MFLISAIEVQEYSYSFLLISGIGGLGENMKVEDETLSQPGWVLGVGFLGKM